MTMLRLTRPMFRLFRAVESLERRGQPATLAAVAREMGRDEAGIYATFAQMAARGFVSRDERGIVRVQKGA